MRLKNKHRLNSLYVLPRFPLPTRGITALRGRLTEHAALTFLYRLRHHHPKVFGERSAKDILQVLFRKSGFPKDPGMDLIVDLLYQKYPGFIHFHNHLPQSRFCAYQYPLIQYRIKKGKPMLVAFDAAIPVVKTWLALAHPDSLIHQGNIRFQEGTDALRVQESWTYYRLLDWNAFNNDNYQDWKIAERMRDRLTIMERALTGQLRNIAEAFGLKNTASIIAEVVLLKNIRPEKTFRHTDLIANILFRSNLVLPAALGIGRSVSIGYGTQQKTKWQGSQEKIKEVVSAFNQLKMH